MERQIDYSYTTNAKLLCKFENDKICSLGKKS